jgi:hypothetical protein
MADGRFPTASQKSLEKGWQTMGVKRVTDREQETERNETKLTYDLTYEDVVDILQIIDNSMGGELHVELGDLKLTVVKRGYDRNI